MVDKEVAEEVGGLKQLTPTSTCVLIEGVLAQTPPGTKQKVGRAGLGAPLPLVLPLWWWWMLLILAAAGMAALLPCLTALVGRCLLLRPLPAAAAGGTLHLRAHCGVCINCTT